MRKILAAGVATTLLIGGAAASVAFGAGFVGAQEADEPEGPASRHDPRVDVLDGLVADGTLTQDQVDALIAAAENEPDGRKIGVLFGLIEDGTLSVKEAEAIMDAIRQAFIEEGLLAGRFGRRAMILASVLDGLVADGTLTQEESDAIVDAFRERCRERIHRHGPEEMAETRLSLP